MRGPGPSSDKWAISEVVHAVFLLGHAQALACFAQGCGLFEEQKRKRAGKAAGEEQNEEAKTREEAEVGGGGDGNKNKAEVEQGKKI